MAIQDDIMAMLSQVSDAGDRATDRGRRGEELYSQIADRLSGDNRSKAMREIAMLSDDPEMSIEEQMRFDPLTGSRVADIIEKYMDDAGDGVSAAVPDDMIVDDTRAAERMMAVMPSPEAAPRTSSSVEELPPMPRPDNAGLLVGEPDFDPDTAERLILERDKGLAGLMAGQEAPEAGLLVGTPPTPIQTGGDYGEFAGTPGTSIAPARVSDGRIPLKERLFAGQEAAGGPMSGGEQLMFASSFIPLAALPAAASKIGMGAAQIARYLRAGKKGEDALRQIIRQRTGAQMMRNPATGRMVGAKDIGPFDPRVRLSGKPKVRVPARSRNSTQEQLYQQMQNPGGPTGGLARGGSVRDKILKTYGGM